MGRNANIAASHPKAMSQRSREVLSAQKQPRSPSPMRRARQGSGMTRISMPDCSDAHRPLSGAKNGAA